MKVFIENGAILIMGKEVKIVLIGAGSVSFGLSTLGDLMTKGAEKLQGSEIVLHDINDYNLKLMNGVFSKAIEEATEEGQPRIFRNTATTDLNQALEGADYVISSIENGPRIELWKQDYLVPRTFGSRQIFGENGGPGGAFHTWRQVPAIMKIVRAMEEKCPKAWFFNFSNPMHNVCRAITAHSKIKTIGFCHGIGMTMNWIQRIMGINPSEYRITSAGLNHYYWILQLIAEKTTRTKTYDTISSFEIQKGEEFRLKMMEYAKLWAKKEDKPLLAEIFDLYGYFTLPDQSHPGEYFYWADSYAAEEKYDFEEYTKHGILEKQRLKDTLEGKENNYWWVTASGERPIDVILGLEYDTNHRELALNLPNNGAITDLSSDCIVEVPAIVNKQGIHAEQIGKLPIGIAQLMKHQACIQDLIADAAVSGDKNIAIQALMMDGTLPSPEIARALFEKMLRLQNKYLTQFKT